MSLLKNTICVAIAALASSLGAVTTVRAEDNASKTVSTQKPAEQDAATARTKNTVRAKGEITFDDIKLDLQKDEPYSEKKMTDAVRKLHEQKVKLRGYILPQSVFQQKGIKQFVLVRDNKECCFGPGAALYDCVMVEMAEGATADYTTRVVAVTGKFEIDTKSFVVNDKHIAIYKIIATSVQ